MDETPEDTSITDDEDEPLPRQMSKQKSSTSVRKGVRLSHGSFKKQKTKRNVFTTSFTKNVQSNNASLAKHVATLKKQNQMLVDQNQDLKSDKIDNQNRISHERYSVSTYINRIEESIKQSVVHLDSYIGSVTRIQAEVSALKQYQHSCRLGAVPISRHSREDNVRVNVGSKTQTVNPMVSGLTITQPTISLARVDNVRGMNPSGLLNTFPQTLMPIQESNATAEHSAASSAESSDDDELDVSLLSRSNRARFNAQSRSHQSSTVLESRDDFLTRVHSEDAMEGTSSKPIRFRRPPQRLIRKPTFIYSSSSDDDGDNVDMDATAGALNLSPIQQYVEPIQTESMVYDDGDDNRTSLEAVDMDVTAGALNLSPIRQYVKPVTSPANSPVKPVATLSSAYPARSPTKVSHVAGHTGTLRYSIAGKVPSNMARALSPPNSSNRVSLVPCTVNMSAGNALDTAKSSVVTATRALPSTSIVEPKSINSSRPPLKYCTVNMSSLNTLKTLPVVLETVTLSALERSNMTGLRDKAVATNTVGMALAPCTVNLSATGSRDRLQDNKKRLECFSGNALSLISGSSSSESVVCSQLTLNTTKTSSSEETPVGACISANPITHATAASFRTPVHSSSSAEASSTSCRTRHVSTRKEPSTKTSPSRNRSKAQKSRSATEREAETDVLAANNRSEPLKKMSSSRTKKPARCVGVENDIKMPYAETPTSSKNEAGTAVVLLSKMDCPSGVTCKKETEGCDSGERIRQRALRRIGPTNYKEPSLNKKMRRDSEYT